MGSEMKTSGKSLAAHLIQSPDIISKKRLAAPLLFFCLNLQTTSTWKQDIIKPADSARNRQEIQHDLMVEFAKAKRDLAINELESQKNCDACPPTSATPTCRASN